MPSEAVGFSPPKHQSIQCRLKPTYHYSASIPLGGNMSGMGRFIRKSPF
ncbi:hypothetical protein HHC09_00175 [Neisseria meningitidis]|nr:hypothetical protein [Neisseria meningitidis]MBW3897004.1 hypothetical protein [Neisseria meningitidis]MBW3900596.1 hypothetical protein [Neisseria meningitidis]MBW3906519.1 hypothetical protein [Neisseria meningitidis]MBW3911101.1 hypothetical protein [Neisseria meningitidis]